MFIWENPKSEEKPNLPQLITSIQTSHAWVVKSMDVVVHTNVIPSLGTLT